MEILNEFRASIDIERLKNLEDFEEQMNQPLDERVAKGVTMSNLKVEFDFYDGLPNQWCSNLPASKKYISSFLSSNNSLLGYHSGTTAIEHE